MENQETMMKKRDFCSRTVKCRIDGLLEEADNYTRIMNEDYESFFADHAEDMYKVRQTFRIPQVESRGSSGSLEDIRSYLVNKVNNITNTLLGEKLR